MVGSFITFKFRHIVEMFITEDHKENQFIHDLDYTPENETSFIHSLRSLYDVNPQLMLYKVNIKKYIKIIYLDLCLNIYTFI